MHGVVKFGRQLNPGCARPDYTHSETFQPPGGNSHHPFKKAALQIRGLNRAVEHVAMLKHAFDTEVVHSAAERQDQTVIGDISCAYDFIAAFNAFHAPQAYCSRRNVEADHFAQVEFKPMALPVGEIAGSILIGTNKPSGDFM
jgi:hypothetical protein